MTACTNNGGKARRVVTAALVGVLSVGTVPMAALAAGVDGIQTLALDPATAFANGTLTAEDGQGGSVTFPEKDDVTFEAGSGKYLLPTAITIEGETIDFDYSKNSGNVTVRYYQGAGNTSGSLYAWAGYADNATIASNKTPDQVDWEAGTYNAVITYHQAGSQYDLQKLTVTFRVVDTDLSDAVVYNAADGNTDVAKNTFTYNGKAQEIGLAVDGAALDDSKYDIVVLDSNRNVVVNTSSARNNLIGAGDYTVNIYKKGTSSSTAPVKTIKLTVSKLNLSKAAVSISDTKFGNAITSCVADGVTLTSSDVKITVNSPVSVNGAYSATVVPANDDNIEGSATVAFNKVTNVLDSSKFFYGNSAMPSSMNVDLSNPTTFFSEKQLSVKNETGAANLDSKYYDVWYTDEDGNAATAADLQTKGTWKVNVRVNAERSGFNYGSDTQTMTVKVTGGTVASSDIVFKYKGEVCNSLTGANALTYDGSDVLDSLETVVRSGDKTLTEGTDYTLKVVNKDTNKEVDKIVDAGNYTVTVESDGYDLPGVTDQSIDVTVNPVNISGAVYAKSSLMQTFGTTVLIPYTGSEIDPSFTFGYYTDKDGKIVTTPVNIAADDDYTWHELPAGTIDVNDIKFDTVSTGSFATAVDALKDNGFYKLTLALDKDVKNYKFTSADALNTIEVSDQGIFADVANNAWYSEAVYTAKVNKYINGFAGTKLFGPEQSITRADVACILFNMGGGSVEVGSDQWDENLSYVTKFNDVDKNAYYAQAIGWAARFGIVNGYEGSFRPTDEVTREEFAAMLCNYAKAMGKFTASDGTALAELSDGANVSDWAKESVAWAVENGVMGNGGYVKAHDDITRAEVAAMAVNYQPDPLTTGFLGDPVA